MPQLILIKHATPLKDANRPSHEWKLSDAGREQAAALAERLRDRAVDVVVTSTEPKAIETGEIIAKALGVPIESAEGLEEHDRSNVPLMQTREFISTVAMFFKEPNRLVLGRETARDAKERFEDALDEVMRRHESKNVAVVSHGTVLSLFVAPLAKEDPFQLWRRMGLPSYVVVEWTEAPRVVDVVASI